MSDISVKKTEEKYVLVGKNPKDDKALKVTLVVHLDNDERTFSITGKNNMFEFRKSDPYLIQGMIELFEKAVEVGQGAQRLKDPK